MTFSFTDSWGKMPAEKVFLNAHEREAKPMVHAGAQEPVNSEWRSTPSPDRLPTTLLF